MEALPPVTVTYPNAYFQHLEDVVIVISWTTVICLCIAIWDWLTSLGDEITRIWKREKTLISILYLGARYWIFVALSINVWMYMGQNHKLDFCEGWHRLNMGVNVPVEAFSGLILLVRTYAFTRQNRVVLVIMGTCFLGQTAFMCVCVKYGVTLVPWFREGQERGRCFTGPSGNNLLVLGYFLTPLLYASICAGLTIHESLKSRNRNSTVRKTPVYNIFMREGAIYYFTMATVIIVNISFMGQSDVSIQGCAYFFMPLIDATMSCRLVLSLRDADSTQFNSNVNVKSLWATMQYDSEIEPEGQGSVKSMPTQNDTFALATVDRSGGSAAPVNVNIERIVHFSVDDDETDIEKKPSRLT